MGKGLWCRVEGNLTDSVMPTQASGRVGRRDVELSTEQAEVFGGTTRGEMTTRSLDGGKVAVAGELKCLGYFLFMWLDLDFQVGSKLPSCQVNVVVVVELPDSPTFPLFFSHFTPPRTCPALKY